MGSERVSIAFDKERQDKVCAEEASMRDRQRIHRLIGLEEAHG